MDIIVKYGSRARGDSDLFSDSDILVIGEIPHELRFSGLDIVRYTRNRLKHLREKESLFLVHLRDEGVIIKDHNNWMNDFLGSIPDYTPNDQILNKTFQNLSIAASLEPSIAALPCWFDILFVFLRDLLVKLNAVHNHYIFAPDRLLENLSFQQKDKIQNILTISREIKSDYRKQHQQKIFLNPLWASEVIINSFNLDKSNIDTHEIIKNHMDFDPYLVLRLVEYGICIGDIRPNSKHLIKYIKNPARYAWDIRKAHWINDIEFVEQRHVPDQLKPAASAG